MSYTPDNQILGDALGKLIDASVDLRERMHERLRHQEEWSSEHVKELGEWNIRLCQLEIDAMKLRSGVR